MTPTTSQVSREKAGSRAAIPRGRFIWYELLTSDENAAKAFYPKVFGWSTEPFQGPGGTPPYTMWTSGGRFGGVMTLPKEARDAGAPPHWLGYVAVPDTDASHAEGSRRGARTLVGPMDIPSVGRFAVIADPQGAVLSLFTPRPSGDPSSDVPAQGIVSWHELATDDAKQAWEFYQELFGWQKGEAMDMGPMGTYQIFTIEGTPSGGIFNRPKEIPVPNWLYYFKVPNLEATIQKITANGGRILNGPLDVPGGRIAQAMDPQGAAFAVHWVK